MATAAAAPVPVVSAAAGAKTGPTTAVAVNDDNYAEDECTIDFGEEETVVVDAELSAVGRNDMQRTLNREYHGEDYSHYLMEPPAPDYDTDDIPVPTPATLRLKQSPLESVTSTTTRRYQKKTASSAGRPRLSVANPTLPRDIPAPVNTQSAAFSMDDPTAPAAPQFPEQMLPGAGGVVGAGPNGPLMTGPPSPEGRRKSLGTIRERLGRFLSTLKQRPKQRQQQQQQRGSRDYPTGTIHNFSFADSKIGLLMVAEQHRQQGGGGGRGSPDGLAALETCSDIGTSRESWWDVGTLSSARSAQLTVSSKGSSASSRTSRWAKFRKKSMSVPNLRAEDDSGSVRSGAGGGGLSGGVGGSDQAASKTAQQRERSSSSGRDKKTAVSADKVKPSGPAVSPPARSSSSSSSSAGRNSSSTASPPPLPPLRDADSTTHNDGARIPGFLKRLSRPASRDRTRRQRAEPEAVVSTLSYTRTYEEIPA